MLLPSHKPIQIVLLQHLYCQGRIEDVHFLKRAKATSKACDFYCVCHFLTICTYDFDKWHVSNKPKDAFQQSLITLLQSYESFYRRETVPREKITAIVVQKFSGGLLHQIFMELSDQN